VLRPETIDPATRCEALVPMLRRLVGETVSIDLSYEEGSRIRVDPGQLEQVVFNLVLNARDAMSDGGHVSIQVAPGGGCEADATVAVRVSDDGGGMTPETLARCQEPFFTTKGRSRGVGLGLATVASILQRSGGSLDISSQAGQGTTVTAVFPAVGPVELTAPVPVDVAPARVLLVDDDAAVRRFAARVLAEGGYDVIAVSDGATALERADRSGGFDLLVTDVVLSAMSGFQLVRTMGERWPGMPCLLITGYAGDETPAIDVGATPMVTKPFTAEELLRAVASALQATRS
jgi:two-component system cell cycle sensor histidine kinase/response regulator CckA